MIKLALRYAITTIAILLLSFLFIFFITSGITQEEVIKLGEFMDAK